MAGWTEAELRAAVRAYLEMLNAEQSDDAYSKADVRRRLQDGPLRGRSNPSIEYRMRNISSVLAAHRQPTIKGYLAAANVGEAVSRALWQIIREERRGAGQERHAVTSSPAYDSSDSARRPPMVYFNIGWMDRYAGVFPDDETKGAHGYLKHHQHGAEAFNFSATEAGTVRGYRPPGARERTNITHMGAARGASDISNALVVWLAREPGSHKALIVGWYRNATVFKVAREGEIRINGETISYSAEAQASDATLVPTVLRTFQVRSSRTNPGAGFGQKPTWYGAESVDKEVWAYVRSYGSERRNSPTPASKIPPRNLDPELRRKVEKAAVAHATSYYKELYGTACIVRSVEAEAKGWDLEVFAGLEPLLVEVKGLMNSTLVCELTPNEYEKMMLDEYRRRYVVYIVNNALAESPAVPVASVFEYTDEKRWATADGRHLVITPKTAAVLSCR